MKQSEGWISARPREPSGWRRVVRLMLCITHKPPPNNSLETIFSVILTGRLLRVGPIIRRCKFGSDRLKIVRITAPSVSKYIKAIGIPLIDCWHMVSLSGFLNWTLNRKSAISASIEIYSDFFKWDEKVIKFQVSVSCCAGIPKRGTPFLAVRPRL